MRETVHNMSRVLDISQRHASEVHEKVAGASLLRRGKRVEGDRRDFGRERACLYLQQLSEAVERAEATLPLEHSLAIVLAELF